MENKPTADLYKKILLAATELRKKEEKTQKLYDGLFEEIAPGSYPPIIESTHIFAFTTALELVFPGIKEDISYWIYEVPSMAEKGPVTCIGNDKKKYDASKIDEYIAFLLS